LSVFELTMIRGRLSVLSGVVVSSKAAIFMPQPDGVSVPPTRKLL